MNQLTRSFAQTTLRCRPCNNSSGPTLAIKRYFSAVTLNKEGNRALTSSTINNNAFSTSKSTAGINPLPLLSSLRSIHTSTPLAQQDGAAVTTTRTANNTATPTVGGDALSVVSGDDTEEPPSLYELPQFVSSATRDRSEVQWPFLPVKTRKLNDVCRLVRGLHVDEAIIQCNLARRPMAKQVAKCIISAMRNGIQNYNMNRSRLYVAEVVVGRAHKPEKQYDMKAKMKVGIIEKGASQLRIVLKEQPINAADAPYKKLRSKAYTKAGEEKRVGVGGRLHQTPRTGNPIKVKTPQSSGATHMEKKNEVQQRN